MFPVYTDANEQLPMSSLTKVKKNHQKRNRIPLSCSNCRRKKIKCDRTKPICKICQAHGMKNCTFFKYEPNNDSSNETNNESNVNEFQNESNNEPNLDEVKNEIILNNNFNNKTPIINNNDNSQQQIQLLESRIKLLESQLRNSNEIVEPNFTNHPVSDSTISQLLIKLNVNPSDKIHIYDGIVNIPFLHQKLNNCGPLVWISVILKDPFASSLCKWVVENNQNSLPSFQYTKIPKSFSIQSASSSVSTTERKSLLRLIYPILPTKRAIWLFIERFFKYIYPFAPYLDQATFIQDIERITSTDHEKDRTTCDTITQFTLTGKNDMALIGCLLTVIKLASLTLYSNTGDISSTKITTPEESYLLNVNVSPKIIDYAQLCLDEFCLFKRCPLSVLQCAILLREYQKRDGCDGFADGDSQTYTSLLIQMASMMGLNRDPNKFSDNKQAYDKESLLKRKIWYGLLAADNHQTTQASYTPQINKKYYDTEIPTFDPSHSNNLDLNLEKVTIDMIQTKFLIEMKMNALADIILDMKSYPTIETVFSLIKDLVSDMHERLGSFNDILSQKCVTHYENVKKMSHLIIYINVLTFLQPILMHILDEYQMNSKLEMCHFIHQKLLSEVMFVFGNINSLVKSSNKFFDAGFDIFLVPVIEIFMHKGLIFFISSFIKANILEIKLNENSTNEYNSKMIQLVQYYKNGIILGIIQKVYIPSLRILSKKYFYAWRMLKVNIFVLKTLNNKEHDYSTYKPLFNYFEYLDLDKFWKLIQITNWKNYEIGTITQPWFDEWLAQTINFSYNNKKSDPNLSLADDISVGAVSEDGSSTQQNNDSFITEDDKKWFTRLFAKYAEQNEHSTVNDVSARRGSFIKPDSVPLDNPENNSTVDYELFQTNSPNNDEFFGDALRNFNMENFFSSMDPMGIDIDNLFQ